MGYWLDRLDDYAQTEPDREAYLFLDDQGREVDSLHWSTLAKQVRDWRDRLAKQTGVVFLVFDTGPEFIALCLACFEVGLTAAPAPPLDRNRLNESAEALGTAMDDAGAIAVFSCGQPLRDLRSVWQTIGTGRVLCDAHTPETFVITENSRTTRSFEAACLLYTSGSTSSPKGVALTHANPRYNGETCSERWQVGSDSVLVSWMPHHHSFGLVFNLFVPLCSGAKTVLLPPRAFSLNPAVWLETIAHYRGTISAAAPFAYRHCAEHVTTEQSDKLDLSTWRTGLIAAEPVTRGVCAAFHQRFAANGLHTNFFCPLYGLSETGPVTSMPAEVEAVFSGDQGQPRALDLAGLGDVFPDTELIIVDPTSRQRVTNGEIGEIWLRGPSLMAGYWGQSPNETFESDPGGGDSWFRTGDLGFWNRGLTITGRLKEIIIVHGKNYYPHDIEWAARKPASTLEQIGSLAAITLKDGESQQVTLVAEASSLGMTQANDLAKAFRQAVVRTIGLTLDRIVFTPIGSIPKTRSGKMKRAACALELQNGCLPISFDLGFSLSPTIAVNEESEPFGDRLMRLIGNIAEQSDLELDDRLGDLALNSLQWLTLAERITDELQVPCHPSVFFKAETLAELSELLDGEP